MLILLQIYTYQYTDWFSYGFSNGDATLRKRRYKVLSTLWDDVSTSGSDVVSTYWNVKNTMSVFFSFSASDHCYFNIEATLIRRWNVAFIRLFLSFKKLKPVTLLVFEWTRKKEAFVRRCSVETMFLKALQNSHEQTCARVFFNKVTEL